LFQIFRQSLLGELLFEDGVQFGAFTRQSAPIQSIGALSPGYKGKERWVATVSALTASVKVTDLDADTN
jgi:hypothetical protein